MKKLLLIALGVLLGVVIAPLVWVVIWGAVALTAELVDDADRDPL